MVGENPVDTESWTDTLTGEMRIEDKLKILADAAKYDVSCASSGSRRKNTGKGLGNAAASGICHSFTEDGRCVSLLKILLTNHCIYNCDYCVNRQSNDVPRAAFTPKEVADLTIDFYRRNYIEGLFLSSGVMRSPDDTMERLVLTVKLLRENDFNGYIHLKCVPDASRRLVEQAGVYADRLSVNIELPSNQSLKQLTRKKTFSSVLTPMGIIQENIAQTHADRKHMQHAPPFAPAGQSTQLIIGASPESDYDILSLADRLYKGKSLKRVYYSAYIPVMGQTPIIPGISKPPLQRENRLYQSDWLIRFYGFSIEELITPQAPFLDLKIDPKHAYAIQHPEMFPVDINTADREMILRVPGIGIKSVNRIVSLRRKGRIRLEHLKQMGVVLSRAYSFIHCDGMPTVSWANSRSTAYAIKRPAKKPKAVVPIRWVLLYDGTFEGLLNIVFMAFRQKRVPDSIERSGQRQLGMFEEHTIIETDAAIAERVWKGIGNKLGSKQRQKIYHAFLSHAPGVEKAICQYLHDAIPGFRGEAAHLSSHIQITSLSQRVRREAHRLKGFVRFRNVAKGRYLALVAPRYDVLPLIQRHFEVRFADQQWIIYDTQRSYGLVYDGHTTHRLPLDLSQLGHSSSEVEENELLHQQLWRQYYQSVNINLRDNPRLHLQHLPRRFWPYLPEKQ